MFTQQLRAAIKSNPIAYNALLPCIKLLRRTKYELLACSDRFRQDAAMKHLRQHCSHLPEFVTEPVFVKVGANDGITGDPCSDILLSDERWKGLLIEPVPYCFARLKGNFHDSNRFSLEQVAIGPSAGMKTFYYVDQGAAKAIPDLPCWFDQLGSFDKQHILKHLDGILAPFIAECTIEVATLTDVLIRNGIRDIHLLHIDTEGYDYEVLKSLDFNRYMPLAILIEHQHLPDDQKTEMFQFLRNHQYDVRNCGGDYFAINNAANKRLRNTPAITLRP